MTKKLYIAEIIWFDSLKNIAVVEAENRQDAMLIIDSWILSNDLYDDDVKVKVHCFENIRSVWIQAGNIEGIIGLD